MIASCPVSVPAQAVVPLFLISTLGSLAQATRYRDHDRDCDCRSFRSPFLIIAETIYLLELHPILNGVQRLLFSSHQPT
jgi:hypothetical protein